MAFLEGHTQDCFRVFLWLFYSCTHCLLGGVFLLFLFLILIYLVKGGNIITVLDRLLLGGLTWCILYYLVNLLGPLCGLVDYGKGREEEEGLDYVQVLCNVTCRYCCVWTQSERVGGGEQGCKNIELLDNNMLLACFV
ncbi:hypothetical protein QBC36DRAFT_44930 [Triangularia setosa]|uniref:Transmembrane protein n=1 Tax=Triangularia setosa TaxID=2587417 RepID=A0AAN6W2M1_9PEZI|nr:hypothetical protein QBC36DRAFT_44930 [Podospora setosa]